MGRFEARACAVTTGSGADVSWSNASAADQLDRQRAASFASMYFSYPGVSEATLRKAADCAPSPCLMLIEGATANRTFGAYAASDNSDLIGSLLERYSCELAVLQRIRHSRELPAGERSRGCETISASRSRSTWARSSRPEFRIVSPDLRRKSF
jgi:hypothetical protein